MVEDMDSIRQLDLDTGRKIGRKEGQKEGREKERARSRRERDQMIISLMRNTDFDDQRIHQIYPYYSLKKLARLRKISN